MVKFGDAFVLLAASFLAALISIAGSARTFGSDANSLPNRRRFWMVFVEDFYRVFLIHLAFAAVLLALSTGLKCSSTSFWNMLNPQIPAWSNLIYVFLVAYCLSEGSVELTWKRFLHYVVPFGAGGLILFAYAVASVYCSVP